MSVGGIIWLLVLLLRSIPSLSTEDLPPIHRFVLSFFLLAVSILFQALSWSIPLSSVQKISKIDGTLSYLSVQSSKYLPGGVVHLYQQYDGLRQSGMSRQSASRWTFYHLLQTTLLSSISLVSIYLLLETDLDFLVVVLLFLTEIVVVFIIINRRFLEMCLRVQIPVAREKRKVEDASLILTANSLWRMRVLGFLAASSHAAAFSILLPRSGLLGTLVAMSGYILAFLLGFLVVGLPSGLGLREASASVLLSDLAPGHVLLTAVLIVRVSLMFLELTFGTVSLLLISRSAEVGKRHGKILK